MSQQVKVMHDAMKRADQLAKLLHDKMLDMAEDIARPRYSPGNPAMVIHVEDVELAYNDMLRRIESGGTI